TGGHGFRREEMAISLDELKAAADTAHGRGKRIRGHIVSKRGIMTALDLKFDLVDHADQMDDECIERFVRQNTFVTPSLYFCYSMVEQKRLTGNAPFLDSEMERGLENSYRTVPRAHAAGVKLVVGDDFGVAGLMHGDYAKELDAYVTGA